MKCYLLFASGDPKNKLQKEGARRPYQKVI